MGPAVLGAGDPETEVTVSPRAGFTLGAGYGSPLGFTGTAELMYGLGADVRSDRERVKGLVGGLLQLHAGQGGGKVSLGVAARARVTTEDFRARAAPALELSVARTREDGPWWPARAPTSARRSTCPPSG